MKLKKQTINLLLLSTLTLAITACGGGGGNNSSNACNINFVDSDGDGFKDYMDYAPNDASKPLDFSTLEKIVANPKVKAALEVAKNNGVAIDIQTGSNPPNLTGYYKSGLQGYVVDSYGGLHNGRFLRASERRACTVKGLYKMRSVEFVDSFDDRKYGIISAAKIRGEGNRFTMYYPFLQSCSDGTNAYSMYIESGKVNGDGDIVEYRSIEAEVAYTGSTNCGIKWKVRKLDTFKKVTDLSKLEHMCVDGDKAYVPKETWTNRKGESCRCSTDHEAVCQ